MNRLVLIISPLLALPSLAELDVEQLHYLKSSSPCLCNSDFYGHSVALSGDYAVVGTPFEDGSGQGINSDVYDEAGSSTGAAYIYFNNGSEWVETTYLKASNSSHFKHFGSAVALDGDTLVVGASGERSNATGVDGDQSDSSLPGAGAAYVFVRDGAGNWSQQAYLKASNTDSEDSFGTSVAISDDTILVGAPGEQSNATGVDGSESNNDLTNAGAVYVFERDSSDVWSQTAYLKPSNTGDGDEFGGALALDGSLAAIGSVNEDSSGSGVNPSEDGDALTNSGAGYIFVRNAAGVWSEKAYLKAQSPQDDANFGASVSVSGETVAMGAAGQDQAEGSVFIYVRSGSTWVGQAILKADDQNAGEQFGSAVSLSGQLLLVGASEHSIGSGKGYLFQRQAGSWSQQAGFRPDSLSDDDSFGEAVALDGDMALIGTPGDEWIGYGVDPEIFFPGLVSGFGAAYFFKFSRPLDIASYQKNKLTHTIEFVAESDLTGWKLKGSTDLRFGFDHSAATVFTEVNPGYYRAVLRLSVPEEPRYFFRIELDE